MVTTADRLDPRRARWTRSSCRTRRTRTSWSTRPRTSPRCSGGCCAAAGPAASWTIVGDPAQSSWPDPAEADRAIAEIDRHRTGPPVPDEHQLPQPGGGVRPGGHGRGRRPIPQADLPRAVRSTGVEPQLLVAGPDGLVELDGRPWSRAAERGGGHGRGDLPAVAGLGVDRTARRGWLRRRRATAPWSRRWSPRVWSTTAVLVVDPGSRSWRSRPAASARSTSR